MSAELEFDEERSRLVEAVYLTPDVAATRHAVLRALELRQGERFLDVGVGPGLLAAEAARTVGPAGQVCGIDLSVSMLALARRRCADLPWVAIGRGDATALAFPDGVFDAAAAVQVYAYVEDLDMALAELFRALRPGGRAVVLDTDLDSMVWHAEDQERMDRILAVYGQHAAYPNLPRILGPKLRSAGFTVSHRDLIPIFNPELHPNTFSHGSMEFVAGFVRGRGVAPEVVAAWLEELRALGAAGRYFFSLNRYVFLVTRPEAI
jgi:SAM-dependent methyltransferase